MNIGAFKEAAEHFLSALVSQKTASGRIPPPESSDHGNEQLWRTLKKTFILMVDPFPAIVYSLLTGSGRNAKIWST